MAINYVTVPHRDLSRGIDQKSAENQIPDGYSEDLLNVVTNSNGTLAKRTGYQGVTGLLPIRTQSISGSAGSSISISLPAGMIADDIPARPVIVACRTSEEAGDNGPFTSTTTTFKYYDESQWVGLLGDLLTLTETSANTVVDTNAEVTIWGLDPAIDVDNLNVYRREAESTLLCALGGSLYEQDTSAAAKLLDSNINLVDSVDGTVVIGPALFEEVPTLVPTRGYISCSVFRAGYAEITNAEWNGNAGEVEFTLSTPSYSHTIDAAELVGEFFTVTSMGYEILNGTHEILEATYGASTMTLVCSISTVTNNMWDENDAGGRGGIFSYVIPTVAASVAIAGDIVGDELIVRSTAGVEVTLDNITDSLDITGYDLDYTRVSDELYVDSTDSVVFGDMLTIGDYERKFRVTAIDTSNSLITIDESITVTDGDTVSCDSRWIPIDYPHVDQTAEETSRVSSHRSINQLGSGKVRSTLIGDSTYLTTPDGPIFKFDGENITRSGLIPWHPGCWLTADYRNGGITPAIQSFDYTAVLNDKYTVDTDDAAGITTGMTIIDSADGKEYRVDRKVQSEDASTDTFIFVDSNVTSTTRTGTITSIVEYRYYYRLNLIDANNNIVSSAMSQSSDYRIRLAGVGNIRHKLIGFPTFEGYDFARIECEIYRTIGNTVAPFYRIATIPVSFKDTEGYILFTDTTKDIALDDSQLDLLSSISGQELGNGWEAPPRASYITSTSSKLVAASIESDWRMKLDIRPFANEGSLSDLITRNPTATAVTLTDGGVNSQVFEFIDNGKPIYKINGSFGGKVALSGDGNILVVGAEADNSLSAANGLVHIFKAGNNNTWLLNTTLRCSYIESLHRFGCSVACNSDGSVVAVGAYGDTVGGNPNAGAAFVYSGDNWGTETILRASDAQASDFFGLSIACSSDGSTVVVGAEREDTGGADAGSAYVYSGSNWGTETILRASDAQADDKFGTDIACSSDGSVIVISADREDGGPGNPASSSGAVYVYEDNSDSWATETILRASDAVAGDVFGNSVACNSDGSVILVGASTRSSSTGAVYIYEDNADSWATETILTASDAQTGDQYGYDVTCSSDGSTVVVGAITEAGGAGDPITQAGAAYVLEQGGGWAAGSANQTKKLTASDAEVADAFGASVACSTDGTLIISGALGVNHFYISDSIGAIYSYSGTTWSDEAKYPEISPKEHSHYRYSSGGTWSFTDGVSFTVSTDRTRDAVPPSVGEWVYLYNQDTASYEDVVQSQNQSAEVELGYVGWWQVASSTSTSFTINWTGTTTPNYASLETTDVTVAGDLITLNDKASDFPVNTRVVFETDDTIPTGITAGVVYYVLTNDGTDITLSDTRGGTVVTISAQGTGPHRIYAYHLPTHWCTAYTSGAIPVPTYQDYTHGEVNGTYLDSNDTVKDWSGLNSNLMKRLSQAINATQAQIDSPWMWARAGNDFPQTQVEIHFDDYITTTPTITLGPAFSTLCRMYVDGTQRSDGDTVECKRTILPSRLIASYPNYAEIFDRPFTSYAPNSESAYDINAADGEEITGIAAFFGESAFAGSQLDDYIAVWKRSSVYVVNLNASLEDIKVRRLESHGQGCTAPDSIASTANGIIYANESGMWRLNRDLSITYVGEPMERRWRSQVNKQYLSNAIGFHYDVANRYQLAVPVGTNSENSECYVYDYTREGKAQELGSWTRFDNHPISSFVNLDKDIYLGTTRGGVYSYRRTGDVNDYRDDTDPINAEILYKACAFGDESTRKACGGIVTHWRSIASTSGTTLETAVDLKNSFESAGSTGLVQSASTTVLDQTTGIGDVFNYKVETQRNAIANRRFNYLQLLLSNNTLDEPFELAGIDFIVGGLNHKGTKEAGQ